MKNLSKEFTVPNRPNNISKTAQWLAGEGAGSWFEIIKKLKDSCYSISRFSVIGNLECSSIFITKENFNIEREYTITYPSHCAKVSILQNNKLVCLHKR